jgi:hypothetical protein
MPHWRSAKIIRMKVRVVLLSIVLASIVACDNKSEIKVYRVSKAPLEEEASGPTNRMPANAPSPSMPGGLGAVNAGEHSNTLQIKWELPQGWTQVPPSAMRYASFSAGTGADKIDVSVITFAGEGGSDIDNVNRWRGQIGLPPASEAAINLQITKFKAADAPFAAIDLAGPNARTLAAWTRRDGRVWFFKATGPDTAVDKEKANFTKFVQSVRF